MQSAEYPASLGQNLFPLWSQVLGAFPLMYLASTPLTYPTVSVYSTSGVQTKSAGGSQTVLRVLWVSVHVIGALGSFLAYLLTSTSAAASALLLLSSLPRVTKGPVPIILSATSATTGAYYGKLLYNLRG